MLKSYLYTGPFSGVTLPDGSEVLLHPGRVVQLPDAARNAWVAGLLARGHLIPAPPSAKAPGASQASAPDIPPIKPKPKKGGE